MFILTFILFVAIEGTFQSTGSPKERVVTEYSDVYNGVKIDFSYNESSSANNFRRTPSAPGCPKSEVGILPWVYFDPSGSLPTPEKCYLVGQIFYCTDRHDKLALESGTYNGICVTKCFLNNGVVFDSSKMQFCEIEIDQNPTREFVFHPEMKRSFPLYEQGPCKDNEWLVKVKGEDKTSPNVICQARDCPENMIPKSAVKEQAYANKKVEFPFGNPLPSNCTYASITPPTHTLGGSIPTPPPITKCEEGEKYSKLLNICVKDLKVTGSGLG